MMQTHRLREVQPADLAAMARWLPPDAERTIPADAAGEWWLAAVGPGSDAPVAALRVRTALGLDRPRYWYRVGCMVHAAAELGLFQRQSTLQLGNDHTGSAELADLAVDATRLDQEQARQAQRALQAEGLRRLHAEAAAGRCTADTIVAELPGRRDAAGRSPFWDGLGRHFHAGDPDEARARFGVAWRTQVAALMPRQCIYVSMLSPDAQSAIGQVDAGSAAITDALVDNGFARGHHIRIDDGGPVFERRIG